MAVYIALLRGINVGGKNIIRMEALKGALEELGLQNVQTYIQSGNVLFASPLEEAALVSRIEVKIKDTFGFPVPVILRTGEALKSILANCPFSSEEAARISSVTGVESLYAAFFAQAPPPELTAKLFALPADKDRYLLIGRDMYLLLSQSIRESKLAATLQKAPAPPTVRNMNTLEKLFALAQAMRG